MASPRARFAVIGGSGFYALEALGAMERWRPETPYGPTSDAIVIGSVGTKRVAFLPRHGVGHVLLPHEIPGRANMWALKQLGVEGIVAVAAVGSLQESVAPLEMVAPDQLIDWTRRGPPATFFGEGVVAHASLADPFCADLGARLVAAGRALGQTVHAGGAYVCIDGPQFSTRAESAIYRSWGASVIGMTAAAEAKLAGEAEMAYGLLATVTDYDVWHASEEDVSTGLILERLRQNVAVAREVVWAVLEGLPADWESPRRGSMAGAVVTAAAQMPASRRAALGPILGGAS